MTLSRRLALVLIVLFAAALIVRIYRGRTPQWIVEARHAAPLAQTRGIYRQLIAKSDSSQFEIDCVALPAGAFRFEIRDELLQLGDGSSLPEIARESGAAAACNGGFFDAERKPVGLMIIDGQTIAPLTDQPPLSGVVGVFHDGSLGLLPVHKSLPPLRYAIQAGPFLIDPGGTIGVRSDAQSPARRTFVAATEDGTILLGVTSEVSLLHLAQVLASAPAALGVGRIERALNLDGGPSSALFVDHRDDELYHAARGPVRGVILARPRAAEMER